MVLEHIATYPQRAYFTCCSENSFILTFRLDLKTPLIVSIPVSRLFSCPSSTSHDSRPDGTVRSNTRPSSRNPMTHTPTAANSTQPSGRYMCHGLYYVDLIEFVSAMHAKCSLNEGCGSLSGPIKIIILMSAGAWVQSLPGSVMAYMPLHLTHNPHVQTPPRPDSRHHSKRPLTASGIFCGLKSMTVSVARRAVE